MGPRQVLGVEPGATPEEIKKAYKKLALKHHPDRGGDPEEFKKISAAYEALTNPQPEEPQFDTSQFFSQMFGGFNQGPTRCADHRHELYVSLEDVYSTAVKHMKVTVDKICSKCQIKCSQCNGQGRVNIQHQMGPFSQVFAAPCQPCQASGHMSSGCQTCSYKKVLHNTVNLDIAIPENVQSGFEFRVKGLGEQGRSKNEVPGDLIIIIRVQDHPVFMRYQKDLVYIKKCAFADTVEGFSFEVPHFDGPIKVNTQKFGVLDPRKDYTVSDKGMQGGDLKIQFDIQYPPADQLYSLVIR